MSATSTGSPHEHNVSLRTGCFCNPGAGEIAFTIARETLVGGEFGEGMTLDDYVEAIGLPSGGAIRASLGIATELRRPLPLQGIRARSSSTSPASRTTSPPEPPADDERTASPAGIRLDLQPRSAADRRGRDRDTPITVCCSNSATGNRARDYGRCPAGPCASASRSLTPSSGSRSTNSASASASVNCSATSNTQATTTTGSTPPSGSHSAQPTSQGPTPTAELRMVHSAPGQHARRAAIVPCTPRRRGLEGAQPRLIHARADASSPVSLCSATSRFAASGSRQSWR